MPHTPSSSIDSNQHSCGLNDRLNKRLLAYMATAGAAGVSMLAMAQSADAKVIYTPADKGITTDGGRLDLNNDGMADFQFVENGLGNIWTYFVGPVKFNKIMNRAAPLAKGVSVGPGGLFGGGAQELANFCICSGSFASTGPWAGVEEEYVGFEFNIKGSVHFGWARISAVNFGLTLTGYAYETIPSKPIVTGDTGSADEDSVDEQGSAAPELVPAGLGHLALGAMAKSTR
jgi:hypothetical protein